jgi:hypothetical protein
MMTDADELTAARRWASARTAEDAARRMEKLAEDLERVILSMPDTDKDRERCDAAALAYRESARIVREEGGDVDG